jgi:hypothetical protein
MLNVNMYTNFECGHFLVILRIGASALPITTAACFVFSIRNFKFPLYSLGKKQPNNVFYTLDMAAAAPATACSGPPVGKAGWNPIQNS